MCCSGLQSLFHPRSVAVIGASDNPASVGYAVFQNLRKSQFSGQLIPINLEHSEVQGQAAYPSLNCAPLVPDLVVVCTPAGTVPDVARSCGELGVGGMIVISAGFREVGEAGRELELQLRSVLNEYPGLRLIGPNCLGVLVPGIGLNASFSASMPSAGNIAVISQSGALCTAMLDWAADRGLGFSAFVSVGNMLDVGIGELIENFESDPSTAAILLYVEALTDAGRFLEAAARCTRKKPIIALKAGRFAESTHAACSHTGALAGADAAYAAAFRRTGITRVFSFDELFDCAKLLQVHQSLSSARVALITNAGGPGIMASDAWLAAKGQIAELTPETVKKLNRLLPPQWSHGNPVDLLGDATDDRFVGALEIISQDVNVDVLVVMLTPQAMTDATKIAEGVARFHETNQKPLLAVWMGGPSVRPGRHILEQARIPVYVTPEQAMNALSRLVSVSHCRQATTVAESVNKCDGVMTSEFINGWHTELMRCRGLVSEATSKQLLAAFGIQTVPTELATSAITAMEVAARVGFPVALKISSPDIPHKTDVGGVALNLNSPTTVEAAYHLIMDAAQRACPHARIDGVSVQPMVRSNSGVELLVGATRDAQFGPLIVVGSGGVTAEIQHDVAMELLPLCESQAKEMLRRLRIFPLLSGFRGAPGVDLSRLADTIVKFSRLVAAFPEIDSIEINPLLVSPASIIALDARINVSAEATKTCLQHTTERRFAAINMS